jgi:hypothetical protein
MAANYQQPNDFHILVSLMKSAEKKSRYIFFKKCQILRKKILKRHLFKKIQHYMLHCMHDGGNNYLKII